MKEAVFYVKNRDKWRRYEDELSRTETLSPDRLADVYIDVANDVSFAQTHYPHSQLGLYLNGIATRFHHRIYRRKAEKRGRFGTFWTREVPLCLYDARKELLASLAVVAIGTLIGAFSSAMDEGFKYSFFGASYVETTLANIRNGDPTAIYKNGWAYSMFLAISLNNLYVMFKTFVSGMLTSVVTAFMLLYNGIMLGVFHQMFFAQGVMGEAMLSIWIHGSLEIPSLVVSGAAGFALGNGWLFPGSYRRIDAFRMGARRGLKIMVGLVPLIVLAALFESYITRYTGVPDALRLCFILLMLSFSLFYFVLLPRKVHYIKELNLRRITE